MAETSDTKFLNTCRQLLDLFAADVKWNPSNKSLATAFLEARLNESYPLPVAVETMLAPQKIKVNARKFPDTFGRRAII